MFLASPTTRILSKGTDSASSTHYAANRIEIEQGCPVRPPPRRIWIFTITTRPPPTFTTLHTTTETEQRSDPFVAPSEAVYLSKDIAVVRPSIVFGKGMLDGVSDGVEEAGKRKPASERATNR